MRKIFKYGLLPSTRIMFYLWGFLIVINLLSRFLTPAVDFYIEWVFPVISDFWCSVFGLFHFSVGEYMIIAGLIILGAGLLSFILLMIFTNKRRHIRISWVYGRIFGWLFTWLFFTLTFQFFLLYQGSRMSEELENIELPNEQVLDVYALLVDEANSLAKQVERDDTGHFVLSYDDNYMLEAKNCMRRIADDYRQFKGYYPDAKPISHAYFFTQQNLLGIYYPFSMEANYNPVMYDVNLPVTICHEFTHLKGNIFEDEAGYLAFRACITSENPDFLYSGYISALSWLSLDFGDDDAAWNRYTEIKSTLSPDVLLDMNSFVPEDYYQKHQHEEVIPTAIVSDVSDKLMDASLKANGIPEGKASYHGLTALVLNYYIYG